ncbi:MAG: hypothetical protein JSS99_16910 [Actinobacteria bacterium]|nr:hypothetical protein [Actinomycetota bacterium]
MAAPPPDSTPGPAGGRLGADLAARVAAIVDAAEREARVAEQAIAEHRRSAEEEARRYLAAARLHVDAETAARAARIETLSRAARRLADELTDAVAALTRELQAEDVHADTRLPRTPWPPQAAAPAPAAPPARVAPVAPAPPAPAAPPEPVAPREPAPSWSRIEAEPAPAPPTNGDGDAGEIPAPSAARLVAIEMAVGGSSRAEVERHLRGELGVAEPEPLLDDVFGVASGAGSRLAWGEP